MLKATAGRWWPCLGWEFGSFGPLWIRSEHFDWGLARPVSLLFASDLHLGHWWTRPVPDQLVAAARLTQPDYLVLGGDLVDHRTGLAALQDLISDLCPIAPVWALAGNHDSCVGEAELRALLHDAGGRWLPDESILGDVHIDGIIRPGGVPAPSCDPSRRHGTGPKEQDIGAPPPRILCCHYPSAFPEAVQAGYRLVLAGHLHGGQCVLATYRDRLYPAAWLHRWHVLKHLDRETTLLVSRGVGDSLPLRFRCPREVILCQIT